MGGKYIPEQNGWGDETLILLGGLVIRASHHEGALVGMMAAMSDLHYGRAWAIFYATANAKARLDMLRALLPYSGLSKTLQARATALLNRSRRLADKRNIIIHSEHVIQNFPKPESPARATISQYQSATKKRWTVRALEVEQLKKLLDDYTTLGDQIHRFSEDAWAAHERLRASLERPPIRPRKRRPKAENP